MIDSGIERHPALRTRIVASVDFTGPRIRVGQPTDDYGHGTHVAGIAAGASREFSGIAPGAHLVNLRVLDENGAGYTSDVVDAINWAVANRKRFGIKIINLSLGHGVVESYRDDPLCEAVERAVAAKVLVVASAGNLGKLDDGRAIIGGITSPGNSPWALTVGALNTKGTPGRGDDVMATYSSRGPTYLDGVLKPDVVAPGNKIVSLGAPGSTLWQTYPELQQSATARGAYFQLSGTSMAAAVGVGGGGAAARSESAADAARRAAGAAADEHVSAGGRAYRGGGGECERGGGDFRSKTGCRTPVAGSLDCRFDCGVVDSRMARWPSDETAPRSGTDVRTLLGGRIRQRQRPGLGQRVGLGQRAGLG